MANVTFKFKTKEAAQDFSDWLCEAGEQGYFQWSEDRESEDEDLKTAQEFNYGKPDKKGNITVTTVEGRHHDDEDPT